MLHLYWRSAEREAGCKQMDGRRTAFVLVRSWVLCGAAPAVESPSEVLRLPAMPGAVPNQRSADGRAETAAVPPGQPAPGRTAPDRPAAGGPATSGHGSVQLQRPARPGGQNHAHQHPQAASTGHSIRPTRPLPPLLASTSEHHPASSGHGSHGGNHGGNGSHGGNGGGNGSPLSPLEPRHGTVWPGGRRHAGSSPEMRRMATNPRDGPRDGPRATGGGGGGVGGGAQANHPVASSVGHRATHVTFSDHGQPGQRSPPESHAEDHRSVRRSMSCTQPTQHALSVATAGSHQRSSGAPTSPHGSSNHRCPAVVASSHSVDLHKSNPSLTSRGQSCGHRVSSERCLASGGHGRAAAPVATASGGGQDRSPPSTLRQRSEHGPGADTKHNSTHGQRTSPPTSYSTHSQRTSPPTSSGHSVMTKQSSESHGSSTAHKRPSSIRICHQSVRQASLSSPTSQPRSPSSPSANRSPRSPQQPLQSPVSRRNKSVTSTPSFERADSRHASREGQRTPCTPTVKEDGQLMCNARGTYAGLCEPRSSSSSDSESAVTFTAAAAAAVSAVPAATAVTAATQAAAVATPAVSTAINNACVCVTETVPARFVAASTSTATSNAANAANIQPQQRQDQNAAAVDSDAQVDESEAHVDGDARNSMGFQITSITASRADAAATDEWADADGGDESVDEDASVATEAAAGGGGGGGATLALLHAPAEASSGGALPAIPTADGFGIALVPGSLPVAAAGGAGALVQLPSPSEMDLITGSPPFPASAAAAAAAGGVPGSPGGAGDWQSRFKVVRIETNIPFKCGRWQCMDYHDQPKPVGSERETVPELVPELIRADDSYGSNEWPAMHATRRTSDPPMPPQTMVPQQQQQAMPDLVPSSTLLDLVRRSVGDSSPQHESASPGGGSLDKIEPIDNKIEQAMDLVKSHLLLAVREEVDVLKANITKLVDKISVLERENEVLKTNASPEVLAKLAERPAAPAPAGHRVA